MDALHFSVLFLLVLSHKVAATNTSTSVPNNNIEDVRINVLDFKVFVSWKIPGWRLKNKTYEVQICDDDYDDCSNDTNWLSQTCDWTSTNETTTCKIEKVTIDHKPVKFRIKIFNCANYSCSTNVNLTDLYVNQQSNFSAPNLTVTKEGPGSLLIVSRIPSVDFTCEFKSVKHKVDIARLPQGETCDSKQVKSLHSLNPIRKTVNYKSCSDNKSGDLRELVNLGHADNYCVWASYEPGHNKDFNSNESPKSYTTENGQHVTETGLAMKVALIGTICVVALVCLLLASRKAAKRLKRLGSFQPSKTLQQLFDDSSLYEKDGNPYTEYPIHEKVDKIDFQLLRKENELHKAQMNKATVAENPYIRLSTAISCPPETYHPIRKEVSDENSQTGGSGTLSGSRLCNLTDEEPRMVIVNGRKFILNKEEHLGQYAAK